MAKTPRIFAAIDVHYFEDDRILEAGDAWQLHLAAILACKRNLSDGQLSRRQLARIAPDSVPDVAQAIAILLEVGLFIDSGTTITIHGWTEWNDSRDDVEAMSKGGKKGNHLRWHVKKNIVDPDCEFCLSQVPSGTESPGDRAPNPREDTDTDTDGDSDFDLDVEEQGGGSLVTTTGDSISDSPPQEEDPAVPMPPEIRQAIDGLNLSASRDQSEANFSGTMDDLIGRVG